MVMTACPGRLAGASDAAEHGFGRPRAPSGYVCTRAALISCKVGCSRDVLPLPTADVSAAGREISRRELAGGEAHIAAEKAQGSGRQWAVAVPADADVVAVGAAHGMVAAVDALDRLDILDQDLDDVLARGPVRDQAAASHGS